MDDPAGVPVIKNEGLTISPNGQAWGIVDAWQSRLVQGSQRALAVRELQQQAWALIRNHDLDHVVKVELGKVLGLED